MPLAAVDWARYDGDIFGLVVKTEAKPVQLKPIAMQRNGRYGVKDCSPSDFSGEKQSMCQPFQCPNFERLAALAARNKPHRLFREHSKQSNRSKSGINHASPLAQSLQHPTLHCRYRAPIGQGLSENRHLIGSPLPSPSVGRCDILRWRASRGSLWWKSPRIRSGDIGREPDIAVLRKSISEEVVCLLTVGETICRLSLEPMQTSAVEQENCVEGDCH